MGLTLRERRKATYICLKCGYSSRVFLAGVDYKRGNASVACPVHRTYLVYLGGNIRLPRKNSNKYKRMFKGVIYDSKHKRPRKG